MKLSARIAELEETETARPIARRTSARATPEGARRRKVRARVLDEVAADAADIAVGEGEGDIHRRVMRSVTRVLEEDGRVRDRDRHALAEELAADLVGLGPLDAFFADPSINEVMCNAHDDIWIEREGRIERTDVAFSDAEHYRAVIDRIVAGVGRRLDEASPMVDARLGDGSRVNVIIPPLTRHEPALTLRRFRPEPFATKDLVNLGTFSLEAALFFEACVRGRVNVVITGGTGSGKTTLLNVLSGFIPEHERVVTIEDVFELRLHQPHVVALEARPANVEGKGEVRIRDLVRNALRMRPDRIVVGECRGAEALDMLQAMNTGHDGSLTTIHANSARDSLSRVETMVLMAGFDLPVRAIREQVTAAIDLIIHQERRPDGSRRITEVSEVQGLEGDTIVLSSLFAYDHTRDRLDATGLRPRLLDRLASHGVDLPPPWDGPTRPRSTARPARPGRNAKGARR